VRLREKTPSEIVSHDEILPVLDINEAAPSNETLRFKRIGTKDGQRMGYTVVDKPHNDEYR